jgi:GlcNAc-P-P-Und epimerase
METVLITGASGFLGRSILAAFKLKYRTITIGRNIVSHSDQHLFYDFSENKKIDLPDIDCVIHCAGKAHVVPANEEGAKEFYTVNVEGTLKLLQALQGNKKLSKFIFISSVAVYGVTEGINITEAAPLLAEDPYGKSKIAAEKLIAEWCRKNNINLYILRLPLIAGKNAPGNLGTMIKGIKSGKYLSIGSATAKKSMILADDLARFLSSVEGPQGIYNLTDGYHPSFKELENMISSHFNKKVPFALPIFAAKMLAVAGDIIGSKFPVNSNKLKKITNTLTFDDTKAKTELQWKPAEVLKTWVIE